MPDNKAEYKIELDAVFQAKLTVLVETHKLKTPHLPTSGSDMINKATALGIDSMLRASLHESRLPMIPDGFNWPLPARAGEVGTIGD